MAKPMLFSGLTEATLLMVNKILIAFCILQLSACATYTTLNLFEGRYEPAKTDFFDADTIVALGKPDKNCGCDASGTRLALVGLKHTYLLDGGAKAITEITESLDGSIVTVNDGAPVKLIARLDDAGNAFGVSGELRISYNKDEAKLTAAERDKLVQLKFNKNNKGIYEYQQRISANVLPPARNLDGIRAKFKQERQIELYKETPSYRKTNPVSYVAAPVAIAFDVITSPVQLIFFGLMNR